MTPTEKEQLKAMYARYNYQCYVCGKQATQRAHVLGNTKANRKLYGSAIIDNPLNWLPVCSLHCNSLVDIGTNIIVSDIIASLIILDVPDYIKRNDIEKRVEDNIFRKRNKRA